MEQYSYIHSQSSSEDLRLYIIEHAILIEELISKSLGIILDIDWEKSKSFGYTSKALSFNQKFQLVQDLKGITNEERNKLELLMRIRNKFAHVNQVRTFGNLFDLDENGKEIKKKFDNFYSNKFPGIEGENIELIYKIYFFHLVIDVGSVLLQVIAEHSYLKGRKLASLEFLETLKKEVVKMSDGHIVISKALENLKSKTNKVV